MPEGESEIQKCLDEATRELDRFISELRSDADTGSIEQELYKLLTILSKSNRAQLEALQALASRV